MEIKHISNHYIEEAIRIARWEYEQECMACKELMKWEFTDVIRANLTELFGQGIGKVAIENNKVVGYLAFWPPFDGALGNTKGVFSPLGGSGIVGDDRGKTASILFSAAAEELMKSGVCSYALSRYAHDEEVATSFIMNGFGIRCSDAIKMLKEENQEGGKKKTITYRELKKEEKEEVNGLRIGLVKHLLAAPTFFPTNMESFYDWYKRDDIRVFAAFDKEEAIGFLSITDSGETFVSEAEGMQNICGAYVKEKYRGTGIANELVGHVCQRLKEEGNKYLGVDCETLNPTALRFWKKQFHSYTYSFHRRIDERCIGYEEYLKEALKMH